MSKEQIEERNVIDLVPRKEQGRFVYQVDPGAAGEVVVNQDQEVVLHRAGEEEQLATISNEGFAGVDLNKLRDNILRQQAGHPGPEVLVDRDGNIVTVDQVGRQQEVAQVTTEGFAYDYDYARAQQEQAAARSMLPYDTRRLDHAGRRGWLYTAVSRDALQNRYQVWTAFEPAVGLYLTYLVDPTIQAFTRRADFDEHRYHLYRDGRVCLTPQIGTRDLATAYSRTVLWANGIDFVQQGGTFPFNLGQDG